MNHLWTYQNLQLLADYLAAVGTWAVAIVGALFTRYLDQRSRPRLHLVYDTDSDEDNKYLAPINQGDKSEQVWIRVRVENRSKAVARDVQLRLMWIKRDDGTWENRPTRTFKVSNLPQNTTSVFPHFVQSFDIAYAKNAINTGDGFHYFLALVSDPPCTDWFEQQDKIERDPELRLFAARAYTVALALLCTNADPKYYSMRLSLVGIRPDSPTPGGLLGKQQMKERIHCELIGEMIDPLREKRSSLGAGYSLSRPRRRDR